MVEEPKIQHVEYWRELKPPTLNQYLYRRAVQEKMAELKGKVGVTTNPDTGRLIPESALAAKDLLKGLTADLILAEHPEWKEDYEREYGLRRSGAENIPT